MLDIKFVRENPDVVDKACESRQNAHWDRERFFELDRTVRWAVLCKVGQRAYNAARILMQEGYDAKVIEGGYTSLKMEEFEVSPVAAAPAKAL